jgi:hypothetical protein
MGKIKQDDTTRVIIITIIVTTSFITSHNQSGWRNTVSMRVVLYGKQTHWAMLKDHKVLWRGATHSRRIPQLELLNTR